SGRNLVYIRLRQYAVHIEVRLELRLCRGQVTAVGRHQSNQREQVGFRFVDAQVVDDAQRALDARTRTACRRITQAEQRPVDLRRTEEVLHGLVEEPDR